MWYFIVSIPDLCHLPYLNEGATSRIPLASAQSKFVFLQKLPEYGNTISQLNTTLRVYRYKGVSATNCVGHCSRCEHVLNVHAE